MDKVRAVCGVRGAGAVTAAVDAAVGAGLLPAAPCGSAVKVRRGCC